MVLKNILSGGLVLILLFSFEVKGQKNLFELGFSFSTKQTLFKDNFQKGGYKSKSIDVIYYRKLNKSLLNSLYFNVGLDLGQIKLETKLNSSPDYYPPFFDRFIDYFGFTGGISFKSKLLSKANLNLSLLTNANLTYVLPVQNIQTLTTEIDTNFLASYFNIDYSIHKHIRIPVSICLLYDYKLSNNFYLSSGIKFKYYLNPMRHLDFYNEYNGIYQSSGSTEKNHLIISIPLIFTF